MEYPKFWFGSSIQMDNVPKTIFLHWPKQEKENRKLENST